MEFRTLIIGGIFPAILLGSGTVLMKLSSRSGISLPFPLVIPGGSVLTYGFAASLLHGNKVITSMASFMPWAWAVHGLRRFSA